MCMRVVDSRPNEMNVSLRLAPLTSPSLSVSISLKEASYLACSKGVWGRDRAIWSRCEYQRSRCEYGAGIGGKRLNDNNSLCKNSQNNSNSVN